MGYLDELGVLSSCEEKAISSKESDSETKGIQGTENDAESSEQPKNSKNKKKSKNKEGHPEEGCVKLIYGGEVDVDERYVAPTIIDNVPMESAVMSDEIFGPILPVVLVESVQDAVDIINARSRPLALYLFTKDSKAVDYVLQNTTSGGVVINDVLMHFTTPALPFGGVGDSGIGAYHGKASFDIFTHHKSVLNKTTHFDFEFRYPPYSDKKLNIIKKLT